MKKIIKIGFFVWVFFSVGGLIVDYFNGTDLTSKEAISTVIYYFVAIGSFISLIYFDRFKLLKNSNREDKFGSYFKNNFDDDGQLESIEVYGRHGQLIQEVKLVNNSVASVRSFFRVDSQDKIHSEVSFSQDCELFYATRNYYDQNSKIAKSYMSWFLDGKLKDVREL